MGAIGLPRYQYLYTLDWLDLVLIERGYDRRAQHLWSAIRWSTFYTLSGQVGGEELKKNNINSPLDLMRLPWERKPKIPTGNQPSEEEVEHLRRLMQEENAKLNNNGKS